MIDNFSLAVSHGLMLLAALLLMRRSDLDAEPGPQEDSAAKPAKKKRWGPPGA